MTSVNRHSPMPQASAIRIDPALNLKMIVKSEPMFVSPKPQNFLALEKRQELLARNAEPVVKA
jgi:hypothetical protein